MSHHHSSHLRRRSGSDAGAPPHSAAGAARFFFFDALDFDEPKHFLDACFLCRKSLAGNGDIFMYRGDTPFCSEECRQEQIDIDEANESNRKLSLHSKLKPKAAGAGAGDASPEIHVRAAGTVVAG